MRESVDVVVPFRGSTEEREAVRARLATLEVREGDTVLVVDNTPGAAPARGSVPVLAADEHEAAGYARNQGARRGEAPWIVFMDADVVPREDLLDRYFDETPTERTGLLAGGVSDHHVPADGPAVERYLYLREFMGQDDTMREGPWRFAKTANVAVRRAAFDEVGGFRNDIWPGEDADLCFRLVAAGWELGRREDARVEHRNRSTMRAFLRQKLNHGAGLAWLEREYPGFWPPRRLPGMLWWGARTAVRQTAKAVRTRDRDPLLWAIFEPAEWITHELGRWRSNEAPRRDGSVRS